jgi:phosphoglucosamine mutase
VDLGVIPTPGVAFVCATRNAPGAVLSASHNPYQDNGIKFFAADGSKLDDALEDEVEALLDATPHVGDGPGRAEDVHDGVVSGYVEHLLSSLPNRLDGLRIIVDCANGSAGPVAAAAYGGAGADVTLINAESDGRRINEACGATHVEALQAAVVASNADAGIAHDGDADRCIAVDASGGVIDGDAILAILAVGLRERGRLRANTVVTTVMTNLGFKHAMDAHGITVHETPVGDRYVLERMRVDGAVLGGEQSGHLLMLDHATTGDGVLTGLHLLARVAETGTPLAQLAAVMTRLPQVLIGVRVSDKTAAMSAPALVEAMAVADQELHGEGRVLVRPSGTEPVIRIMVEAAEETRARAIADRVAAALSSATAG